MNHLRVGVDVTAWRNPRGDGRFVRNAVERLVALHPEVGWVLVGDAETRERERLPSGAEMRAVRVRRAVADAASARRPVDLLRLATAARGLDAFLSPSLYSYFPVPRVPSVVGVHDANSVLHADLVLPSRKARALWRVKRGVAVRHAARLFAVSRAAREQVIDHLGIRPDRITVVPEAPDPIFRPQPPEAVAADLAPLGLSVEEGYFLFAAGLSPHKGVEDLVDAYAGLRTRRPESPPLVLAGSQEKLYASSADRVKRRVEELGMGDAIRFPGFVSDRVLACLYTGATAVAAPSLGEGFGLSPVEAAASGTPSVLSDIGPHRETFDGAALFVPSGDAEALSRALERMMLDRELRESLAERARAAVASLTWDETARRLHALLREAAGPP